MKSIFLFALASCLLAVQADKSKGHDMDDSMGFPSSSHYSPSSSCASCRSGATCAKSLDIPAWYSKSFVVSNTAARYNVWSYQVATTDPSDRLSVSLQDTHGSTYVASDKDYASCVNVTGFVTQESTNKLVIGCMNWFFSCQVNYAYTVGATDSLNGGSTGAIVTPDTAAPTSTSTSASPVVIGLSVGFALLAALLIGLLTWFCLRKRNQRRKEMEALYPMEQAVIVPIPNKTSYLDQDDAAIAQAVAASMADVKVPPRPERSRATTNTSQDYTLPAYYGPPTDLAAPLPPKPSKK